jgi:hypothetical protein
MWWANLIVRQPVIGVKAATIVHIRPGFAQESQAQNQ